MILENQYGKLENYDTKPLKCGRHVLRHKKLQEWSF